MTIQEESRARPAPNRGSVHPGGDGDRDRQLVHAFLTGDVDAFSVIASEHYQSLRTQARRQLGPTGQVEDAVQETFERALKGIRRFGLTGEYRLGPWLSRILSNVCVDQRSRSARHMRLIQAAAALPVLSDDVADEASDPQTVEIVRNALRELPQTHRRAVLLRELNGLAYDEVAKAENISVENARARVSRGKSSLRRALHKIRGVILLPLPLVRLAGRLRGDAFGLGHRAKAVAPPSGRLPRGGTGSTIVDQLAGRLVNTPLGQSAWAIMSSPPKGTFVFGLAATVATVSASTVLLNQQVAASKPPVPVNAAKAFTPLGVSAALTVPAPAPAPAPAATPHSISPSTPPPSSPPPYNWVDPTTQSTDSTTIASLPVASSCTTTDGVAAPGPGFTSGSPLGIADATAVGNTPTTVLATTGSSLSLNTALSVTPFGGDSTTSTTFTISATACLSSSGWLTAMITGTQTSADISVELVGVVEEVIGSPGDLGYIFRGTVVSQGQQVSLLSGAQFAAQLAVAEPANTAQLTIVLLGGSTTASATNSSTGSGGQSTTSSGLAPSISEFNPVGTTQDSTSTSATSGSPGSTEDVLPPFAPLIAPFVTYG